MGYIYSFAPSLNSFGCFLASLYIISGHIWCTTQADTHILIKLQVSSVFLWIHCAALYIFLFVCVCVFTYAVFCSNIIVDVYYALGLHFFFFVQPFVTNMLRILFGMMDVSNMYNVSIDSIVCIKSEGAYVDQVMSPHRLLKGCVLCFVRLR